MAAISDAKLERLIDEFLTQMPGGLSARFISYYINWSGLLDENESCDKKSVNSFLIEISANTRSIMVNQKMVIL